METSQKQSLPRATRSSLRILQANSKPKPTEVISFKTEDPSTSPAHPEEDSNNIEQDDGPKFAEMFLHIDVHEDHQNLLEEHDGEILMTEDELRPKGIIAKLSQKLNSKLNATPEPSESLLACLEPEITVATDKTITSGGVHVCPWCPLTSSSLEDLENHVTSCHHVSASKQTNEGGTSENQHICNECGKAFVKSCHLKRHYIIHTGERPFICVECGERFATSSCLTSHRREHTGEGPFNCKHCSKTFSSVFLLKIHLKFHEAEKSYFASEDDLMEHSEIYTNCCVESHKYECEHCGHSFQTKQNFDNHMRCPEGDKHPCYLCSKPFLQLSKMKVHMRSQHKVEPPDSMCKNTGVFVCLHCKKEFGHVVPLKRHIAIHSGIKPFKCSDCGESFRGGNDLKVHMRVHTGERPFSCPECGESFTQKGNLTVHIRTHTGEKPFECNICGRCFLKSSNLKEHMKVHQEGRGKRTGTSSGGRPPRFLMNQEQLEKRGYVTVMADSNVPTADVSIIKRVSEMAKESSIFRAAIAERLKQTGFVPEKNEVSDGSTTKNNFGVNQVSEMTKESSIFRAAIAERLKKAGFAPFKKNEGSYNATDKDNFGDKIAERLKETGVLSFGNGKISLKLINVKNEPQDDTV